jgi:hypothetical protein
LGLAGNGGPGRGNIFFVNLRHFFEELS